MLFRSTVSVAEIGKLLKTGKPLMGKPFEDASAAVYKAVSKADLYKDKKGLKSMELVKDKKRSQSEKEIFEKYYQEALKAKP